VVALLIRRISFEDGNIDKPILGEMRLSSSSTEKFSDRVLVLLLPYCFHNPQRVPPRAAFYLQMRGLPTGLEPATFSRATIHLAVS